MLTVRLLGPIQVLSAGRPVDVGPVRQRCVLAALAVEPGRPVPVPALIDRVWDERPPQRAQHALHVYLSRIRSVLHGADNTVLVSRRCGGYALDIEDELVDVSRFRAQLARARPGGASAAEQGDALEGALQLWQGAPLADLPGAWAAQVREHWQRLRLDALIQWANARLATGQTEAVLSGLSAAVTEFPLAEPLRAAHMRALVAANRPAEALAVYESTRTRLAADLGVDPGPELSALHCAILRGELPGAGAITASPVKSPAPGRLARNVVASPAAGARSIIAGQLDAGDARAAPAERLKADRRPTPQVANQLPPDLPDYTGHERQLKAACDVLVKRRSQSANPPVIVISGQGGVGKTALAVRIAHRVRAAYPDGQLFLNVGSAAPLTPAEALSRALRALGVTDMDAHGNSDLRERVARFRAELAGRRVLIVVDDAVSARQVQPFLPGDAGSAVLVTSRSRLTTVPALVQIELDVMSAREATALLTRVIGAQRADADPPQTTRLVDLCVRLPLAVRVAGARLAARPHWAVADLADRLSDEHRRLDELRVDDLEVRASLAVSYQGLGPAAQWAFRLLGYLDPPDFTALTLAALLDAGVGEAGDLVEEITDARLLDVVVVDGVRTRYRMHDLVRLYAGELATPRERAGDMRLAVTRTLTGVLQVVERLSAQLPIATPRMCYPAGLAPSTTWLAAVEQADARRWFDAEEPALIAAVERAAALGLDALACGLADALVFASFANRNNFDGWERTHAAAAAAAHAAGNSPAEAAMRCGIGQLRYAQDRFTESREHFALAARIFHAAGDERGRAVALNGLGTVGRELSEHRTAQPQINRALAILSRLGDEAGVAHAHYSLGFAHRELGADDAAFHHLAAARDIYRRLGHRRGELISIRGIGLVHRARGELDAAEALCHAAHAIAVDVADDHLVAYTAQALAKVWVRQGASRRARAPLAEALTTMTVLRDGQGTALTARTIGEMQLADGHVDAAAGQLAHAADLWRSLGMSLGRARTLRDLGAAQCMGGDHDQAHLTWSTAQKTFDRLGVREKDELVSWRRQWGCACPPDLVVRPGESPASVIPAAS
jgi:DNA-binding SARP family transcriptional activator/tetratricopeptide (TPR) repeat protein